MRIIVFAVVILASSCIAKRVTHPGNKQLKRVIRQPCDPKWSKLYANHTMCLNDVGTEVVLDAATKAQIVERHNEIRSEVDPPAMAMMKMIWDDELALVASKWARQCSKEHDTFEMRAVPSLPGYKIGQNLAVGPKDLMSAINAWNDEKKEFHLIERKSSSPHYKQMVTSIAHRVGCGQAKCPGTFSDFYVCNYDTKFDVPWFPYSDGDSCYGCLPFCDASGKLCDCPPTVCLNGGRDLCGCICNPRYEGKQCEIDRCLRPDPVYCKAKDYECIPFSTECLHICGKCGEITEIFRQEDPHDHVFS